MSTMTMKHFKYAGLTAALLFILIPGFLQAGKKNAIGIVFEDTNRNGIYDKEETGIPGVVVSNQSEVTQTDQSGRFRLPVGPETIIFISKPSGYCFPTDKNNLPQFYYIHQPAGSPLGLTYPGVAPTGKLPPYLYFPLIRVREEETFEVIVVSDPQVKTPEEVNLYRYDVVERMMGTKAVFYLALGDIVYDEPGLYDPMNRLVGQLGVPVRHVMGNHDMNYQVPDNKYEAETFKRIYGPDYYSFNYGKVHFLVLNSLKYRGWNQKENKKGGYTGYIHERQLTWLKNDLALVPPDHLVVLTMHVPIASQLVEEDSTIIKNREALFRVLETREHLLALAGHMHFFEYQELGEKCGWRGGARFPSITLGAGCGTWWHGPKNPGGIPYGICTDGSPNGYYLFTFTGNQYNYLFYPSNSASQGQVRINSPAGTLSSGDIKNREINVNVFTGSPLTVVTFQLDHGPTLPLERKIMKDPFFKGLVERNRELYEDWMEPTLCGHIWGTPLPENLKAGLHLLKITAKDHQGNEFTAFRLFDIVSDVIDRVTCRSLTCVIPYRTYRGLF